MYRNSKFLIFSFFIFLFLQSPIFARRIGLVFGSDYRGNRAGIPVLELCEKDAKLMEQSLKDQGKFDHVKVLLGSMVTAANMKSALKEIASIAKKNDTVMIYFSGHGTVQKDSNAPNGMRNYLVMYDRPHVSDKNLDIWLKGIKTDNTVWIFDACFSGGIVKKGRRGMGNVPVDSAGGKVIQNGNDNFYFEGKTLISSADSNETAVELDDLGHGLFTYWFVKGMNPANGDLNSDRVVTVLEAFEWSSKRVTNDAFSVRRRQHPQIVGSPSGIMIAGNARPRSIEPEVSITEEKKAPAVEKNVADEKPVIITEEVTVTETVVGTVPEVVQVPVVERPSRPADPVTAEEPPATQTVTTGKIRIITTILQSRQSGRTTLDAVQVMKLKKLGNAVRRIRVMVSGKEFPAKIEWVDEGKLKEISGESIPLGFYSYNQKRYKNRVAVIYLDEVPSGVHEITLEVDDYPVIRERLGVEKNTENSLFTVASLSGYGSIQGKVFRENFENPISGHKIWLPTVKGVNQIHTMKTTSDGSFWFLNLPPSDDYQLKASIMESNKLDNENLNVKSGDVVRVDVVLGKGFK